MCETMQSSHRLCPAMALVRALLAAPTVSGDGAVERFCAPLPPAPHFPGACPTRFDEFPYYESLKRAYLRAPHREKKTGFQEIREVFS